MDMRDLIAKLTSLEEESSKDKDYDHDSFDKDDEDYIEKNSKEDEEDEYEAGEEDKEVKESVDNSEDEDDEEDESSEKELEECGGGEITTIPGHSMEQTDSVSMTLNMSGSGKGGIHDILDVIRNLEKGKDGSAIASPDSMSLPVGDKELNKDATMIIGTSNGPESDMHDKHSELEDEFSNSPNVKYSALKHITQSGNDLHHDGHRVHTAQPPLNQSEAVKAKLESLYQFIKNK